MELKSKEEEIEKKSMQVDALAKALEKFMKIVTDPKKGAIEKVRSDYMSSIKTNHRIIEKNTNPNTKSQQQSINKDKILTKHLISTVRKCNCFGRGVFPKCIHLYNETFLSFWKHVVS